MKKARAYKEAAARYEAGEAARANDPTGRLQAMYEAFIPTRDYGRYESKYVTDRYGNRILRSEMEELANVSA